MVSAILLCVSATSAQTRRATPPARAKFYTTSLTLDQMKNKQAVVETSAGTFVIATAARGRAESRRLLHEAGAGGRVQRARRSIARCGSGIVQGGDPLSKDPAKRALYGTGGLGVLQFAHRTIREAHARRGVGRAAAGQARFRRLAVLRLHLDQPTLDGQFTVFGRVVEGLDVAQKISELPTDAEAA